MLGFCSVKCSEQQTLSGREAPVSPRALFPKFFPKALRTALQCQPPKGRLCSSGQTRDQALWEARDPDQMGQDRASYESLLPPLLVERPKDDIGYKWGVGLPTEGPEQDLLHLSCLALLPARSSPDQPPGPWS